MSAVFAGGLQRQANGKAFVLPDFNGPSLGALELDPRSLELTESNWDGKRKLRALVNDGASIYDLSIPAEALGNQWRAEGLQKVQAAVRSSGRLHARIGLARAWGGNPCYAQVNGLYLL
jgi:hypothetical protein